MRIFISYRRNDTGGRAGRLFDALVSRLGKGNVFQDVAAIAPGTDFTRQVAEAISRSEAVLVVIGPEWLDVRGAHGTRRLDEPDDYVRTEVTAALDAGVPVVPVLVGGAPMPSPADVPEALRPLINRQAARIDDDSWHHDLDALVRRLDGEAPDGGSRPRWLWPAVAAAAMTIVAGLVWLLGRGDGDDDASQDSLAGELPPCAEPDDSWEAIELTSNPQATGQDHVDRELTLTVDAASARDRGEATAVVLALRLDNDTPSGDGAAETGFFIAPTDFTGLFSAGVSMGSPTCFSVSPRQLAAGRAAEILIGYEGSHEPGSPLVLATDIADLDVTVSDGE